MTNGSATFSQAGKVLTVTNSNGATINWDTFSIGAGYTTHFNQGSASSSVLNRVVTADPSKIYGTLSSNGQVWLINPAGVLVGKGGVIDTARFVASTLKVGDSDFLAGRLNFQATPGAGNVDIEAGAKITTPSGGSVYLIGANVSNAGTIATPQGETILAAGETVSLIDTGTPGVKVEITGSEGNATNLGDIVATAGRVGMAGVIVRNSGTLNASSVVSEGGRVFLKASKDTYVDGAGRIVATGTKGGRVEVLGGRVAVMDQAQIDASGTNGGGTVLVGGDYQGKNPDVQNATVTYFGREASIKADATDSGDGGKVIVWADDTTRAYGTISARGGSNIGNGGFVETSGHNYLDFHARVDTRAPNGEDGTLLLDPADVTIGNGVTSGGSFSSLIFSYGGGAASSLSWADIVSQLGLGNVIITTTGSSGNGDITINAAPSGGANISISHTDSWGTWSNTYYGAGYTSSNSLSLLANRAVNINAWFGNAGSGAINIMAGWNGASTASPVVYGGFTAGQSINISSGGGIASKGAVSLTAVDSVTINGGQFSAGIELDTGALSIVANSILLNGGSSGFNDARARIATNGNQTYTVGLFNSSGGLRLNGSNGMATYGGSAEIGLYGTSGTQSFTIQYGAAVELRGGSSNGYMPAGGTTGSCSAGPVCSNNGASIRNNGNGGQSFVFTAGGSLNLYGGSVGNDNSAEISNRGTGTQTISGSPTILLRGGTSGGAAVVYGGKFETLENSADIESKYGVQMINAATMSLEGGTAVYGGAYVSAPTQNITVSGALTLTGGGGTAPTGYDAYGDVILTNAAIIGYDVSNIINLNVGSLAMQGGTSSMWGGSWALIGGYRVPSAVTISSNGNIALSGASQWSSRIGSLGGYGGSVILSTTSGTINIGDAYVGSGSTGSVTINGYGGVTQSATGRVETNTLTISAAQSGAAISMAGGNQATYVSATAPGNVSYIGVAPTHFSSVISTTGNVSVNVSNTYGYGGWAGLGTLSAINGTVSVAAAQQILDDNGSGTGNITAQGITLVSTNGTTDSSGIAISADVAMSGGAKTISATVNNTATYGGISIRNGTSTAPLSVTMTDQSTTAGHAELAYLSAYDINMTTGAYNLSSNLGGVTFGTTGNLTLNSLATMLPGINDANYRYIRMSGQNVATSTTTALVSSPDLYVNANGALTVGSGHNITAARNVGLNAVGGLTLTNSAISASANVYLGGVNNYGGGAITLTNSSVTAGNGIYAYTGGDIRLNDGSHFSAGNDVNLGLGSTTSTVYLNDSASYYGHSFILSGSSPYATSIGFLTRSADGIVIDGATTMASAAYGSGIFRGTHGSPASLGAGLNTLYGVAASAAVTQAVNQVISTITTTTANATSAVSDTSTSSGSTATIPPPTTTTTPSGGILSLSSGTVGGEAGQFGDTSSSSSPVTTGTTSTTSNGTTSGDASGATTTSSSTSGESTQSSSASGDQNGSKDAKEEKKDDKKDDKSKKADSGGKKDDKTKQKPVGKCSA